MLKKASNILRGDSTHQNKKKCKINMGPEMHTFWDMNICPQWLTTFGCESISVTDKVNIVETNTVWSQSLPKGRGMHLYGRTSRWATLTTSVMNGRQVNRLLWTGRRNYAFPDLCVMVSFTCCDMYYYVSQYWTLLFLATTNKCTELQNSESMRFRTHVYRIFSLFWWVLSPLKISDTCF